MFDIIYENVNDTVAKGRYGEFEVLILRSNGYINATKLCGQAFTKNNCPKRFDHWLKNNNGELLEEISKVSGTPLDQIMIKMIGLPNELRGTYAHPLLIPHIASWASPMFAVKVGAVVNEYMLRKYKLEITLKNKIISDLRNSINRVNIIKLIGYVYVITDSKYHKVGKSNKPDLRRKSLQTGNPNSLHVHRKILCINPLLLEEIIHDRLSEYKKLGEWFDIEIEKIDKVIDDVLATTFML